MIIIDKYVLRASAVLFGLGVLYLLLPSTSDPKSSWYLLARLSFVITFGCVAWVWQHGMKTTMKRIPLVLQFVVPLFALATLRVTTVAHETSMPVAMMLTGGMLITCSLGLVFLFGLGSKAASG